MGKFVSHEEILTKMITSQSTKPIPVLQQSSISKASRPSPQQYASKQASSPVINKTSSISLTKMDESYVPIIHEKLPAELTPIRE